MRRYRTDLFYICILIGAIFIFFSRLFYPVTQFIVTPDFGRSDAWHSSVAMKYVLSQSLKSHTLPIWRSDLGDGTPLLAEGETGSFFLPNLILFSWFPYVTAYNSIVILVFLAFGFGTYLSLRLLGNRPLSSLFASLIFAFSALPILNLTHIALLQGMSLLPIVFSLCILLLQYGTFPWMALLALCISQQLFAGFPQATFLTLIFVSIYALWFTYTHKTYKQFILYLISVTLGIIGGSAQLLPSREYLLMTSNPGGFNFSSATQYSMPLKHVLTFFNPYIFGNPKNGTYPPFYLFDGSIFWENTVFIGLLPIFFIVIAVFRRSKLLLIEFFGAIIIACILLAWGKYSPFYLLFTFWPLNLFRVPSRFLWIATFTSVILAGKGFDYCLRNTHAKTIRYLLIISVIISYIQLTSTWWNYHMLVPTQQLFDTSKIINLPYKGKIFTLGYASLHNKQYIPRGWEDKTPYISFYRYGMAPDANTFFRVSQHDVYLGRTLYRSSLADSLLSTTIQADSKLATVSSTIMLDILHIQTVLSYLPITTTSLRLEQQLSENDGGLRIYSNPTVLPRSYVSYTATTAATLNEAASSLLNSSFTPGKTVLLETRDVHANPILKQFTTTTTDHIAALESVSILSDTHNSLTLKADAGEKNALLILTDTYYPGWIAEVDGKETQIFPVNIKQRAIVLPPGKHTILFRYQPKSIVLGLHISILTHLLLVLLTVAPFGGLIPDIWKKAKKIEMSLPRNHDR